MRMRVSQGTIPAIHTAWRHTLTLVLHGQKMVDLVEDLSMDTDDVEEIIPKSAEQ